MLWVVAGDFGLLPGGLSPPLREGSGVGLSSLFDDAKILKICDIRNFFAHFFHLFLHFFSTFFARVFDKKY